MALANALVRDAELPEAVYPLDLVFCETCSLVQIDETVPPEVLFRHYAYFSSYSDHMLEHARALVERSIAARKLSEESLVVEIASNDGYLLQYYRDAGVPVLGIEPAENVARVAEQRHIPTRCEFFGLELARRLHGEGTRADVVHAHNVLAHVADLNGLVAGLALLLAPDGVAVIEVPYVRELVARRAFDTIYHEHLSYFSLGSLEPLFERHGLFVEDVARVEIHGGSLRLTVGRGRAASQAVMALREAERREGLASYAFYRDFPASAQRVKDALTDLLGELVGAGARIAAYGAAAKGTVLLNYCGIGVETLAFVADRSPHKQGRLMPGVHIPISPPERISEEMPDYVLLLTWNFADEIMAQEHRYRQRGGRFIIPIPEPRVV